MIHKYIFKKEGNETGQEFIVVCNEQQALASNPECTATTTATVMLMQLDLEMQLL